MLNYFTNIFLGQVTVTTCLNFGNENINLYNEINSKNSSLFQQLNNKLSQVIPIDPKRLKINKKIQNENIFLILISVTIMLSTTNDGIERNMNFVLLDLNELIQQKKYNLISSRGITKFFNETYGIQTIYKHFYILK